MQATVFYNAEAVAVVAVGQPVTVRQGLRPGAVVGPLPLGGVGDVVAPGAVSNSSPPKYEEIVVGIEQ